MPQAAQNDHETQQKPVLEKGTASRVQEGAEMQTSYGFQKVGEGEKQPLVNTVFHKVASRYDLMNDLMSAGMHRLWKSAMVARLAPPAHGNSDWHSLDVAGGTGDIAFGIVEASGRTVKTTVLDINSSMLEVGQQRADTKGLSPYLEFIEGNAEELPFENNCFDAYTIAYGIRNVPDINKALREAYRVLKPGGQFLCLEFSEVDVPVLDRIYEQWSLNAIPKIGQIVTGEAEPYQYLVESIRKFPNQETFAAMIRAARFEKVTYSNFTGGIAVLHSGWKI